MTQPTSLSGFWRVNKSHDRAVELKQLQESLQSLAGTLAKSKGRDIRVVWDQSLSSLYVDHQKTSVFTLDASPIIDTTAPVPDSRVDVLAGQVLHHVGHMVAPVRDVMRQKIIGNIVKGAAAGKLGYHKYSNTYEELGIISKVIQEWQVDSYLSGISPAIRDYITAARSWYRDAAQDRIQAAIDACAVENPTFKDVVDLWSLILCYNLPVPDKIDSKVADALVEAISQTSRLAKHPRYIDSVTQAIWEAFNAFAREEQKNEDQRDSQSATSPSAPSEEEQDEKDGEAPEGESEEGQKPSEDAEDEGETGEEES